MLRFQELVAMFSDLRRINRWIEIESAFIKFVFNKLGHNQDEIEGVMRDCIVAPFEVLNLVDPEHFKQIIRTKNRRLSAPEFQYGIDSRGLIITSNSLLIRDWYEMMLPVLNELQSLLKKLAFEYKTTVQIGRTHGVQGEPTSFGYRFAVTYSDLDRYIETLFKSRKHLEVVVFETTNLFNASWEGELKDFLSNELKLFGQINNGRSIPFGRYLNFLSELSSIVQVINKNISDLCLLNIPEVGEISTSPEVRGDMSSIELSSKLIDDYLMSYVNLYISLNSENINFVTQQEKLMHDIMKESAIAIHKFIYVLQNMNVNLKMIDKNVSEAEESVYSQKVLLHLVKKSKFSREEITSDLKKLSSKGGKYDDLSFRAALMMSKYSEYFKKSELESLFDKDSYLENIDALYERIFFKSNKLEKFQKIIWSEYEINYYLDILADKLNKEYQNSKFPVTFVVIEERSLVFAGNLILKLNFPMKLISLPSVNKDLIEPIEGSGRFVILDFLISNDSDILEFTKKISDIPGVQDVRVCAFMKFKDVSDEVCYVDWFAIECDADDFYAGFGKDCGSTDPYRHIPAIGLIF